MKKKIYVLFALLALLIATLACRLFTGSSSGTNLENLRVAFDQDGNFQTTVFSPSDVFYAVADLNNAPAGTVVDAKWLVVQIEGYDPGELIYEQTVDDFTEKSYTGTVYFQLSNDNGWEVGEYKVDIYLDGTFVESVQFSVQ